MGPRPRPDRPHALRRRPAGGDGVPKILGNRLHVLVVKDNGRLSENDADRQHLPVEDGAAPLGIAVVPA